MIRPLALVIKLIFKPIRRFLLDGGVDYAGNVAFLCFLALFPFLIFMTTLAASFQGTEAANDFINWALTNLPPMAADSLRPIIDDVVSKSSGSLLTLSILGTLWISANAIEAFRGGLNRAYGISRQRSFLFHRVQGVAMVILTAISILVAALINLVIPAVLAFLPETISLPDFLAPLLALVEYLFAPILMIGATIILYRFLPDRDHGFKNVVPGALLAYGLWLLLAQGFAIYVKNFANYSVIYGSLGGVIVLLLFLYLAAAVFLIGAEFNVVMQEELNKRKEAVGDDA